AADDDHDEYDGQEHVRSAAAAVLGDRPSGLTAADGPDLDAGRAECLARADEEEHEQRRKKSTRKHERADHLRARRPNAREPEQHDADEPPDDRQERAAEDEEDECQTLARPAAYAYEPVALAFGGDDLFRLTETVEQVTHLDLWRVSRERLRDVRLDLREKLRPTRPRQLARRAP